jgi:hypothetical protein
MKFRLKDWDPFRVENTRFLKGIVSIYPGVAAVLLAFYKDAIVGATRAAKDYWRHKPGSYTLDLWVFCYWVSVVVWIYCYFRFVTNESQASAKTTEGLKGAIFRAPNPKVFFEYRTFYKGLMRQFNELDFTELDKCEVNLRVILDLICQLTTSYISRRDNDEIYGANIMLYLPIKLHRKIVEKLREKPAEWIHLRQTELSTFNGVLYFVPELAVKGKTESDEELTSPQKLPPTISLPVIKCANEVENANRNIPGAPRAATEGNFIFSDTRDTGAYSHLGQQEVKNAKNYWEQQLPNIHSIVSFGIPHKWAQDGSGDNIIDIVGVLNIDSTKRDILGTETEYHPTYYSLVYPVLCQLGPALVKYYELYIKKLDAELG